MKLNLNNLITKFKKRFVIDLLTSRDEIRFYQLSLLHANKALCK